MLNHAQNILTGLISVFCLFLSFSSVSLSLSHTHTHTHTHLTPAAVGLHAASPWEGGTHFDVQREKEMGPRGEKEGAFMSLPTDTFLLLPWTRRWSKAHLQGFRLSALRSGRRWRIGLLFPPFVLLFFSFYPEALSLMTLISLANLSDKKFSELSIPAAGSMF